MLLGIIYQRECEYMVKLLMKFASISEAQTLERMSIFGTPCIRRETFRFPFLRKTKFESVDRFIRKDRRRLVEDESHLLY